MQQVEGLQVIGKEIEKTLLTYYDYSFRIENEKCMVLIEKLLSQLETLFIYIDKKEIDSVQGTLLKAVQAMDNKDYVLLRDVLYYDLYPLIKTIA